MREGDLPHIQHYPTALSIMIGEWGSKIYWNLSVLDGADGGSLHRHCTMTQSIFEALSLASSCSQLMEKIWEKFRNSPILGAV
jgi:hypothetical protein